MGAGGGCQACSGPTQWVPTQAGHSSCCKVTLPGGAEGLTIRWHSAFLTQAGYMASRNHQMQNQAKTTQL